jgi:integration host factor subunit alpha
LSALTKQTIIEKISEELDQSPSEAKDTIEHLLEIMKSTLASGEVVMISGFGKFQVNEKAPRKGRNPATGKDMILEKRRVVVFKCAGILRDLINGGENGQ